MEFHNVRMIPAPAARDTAMATASVSLETPESISPVRKSLRALVSAAPGTKSIKIPIITKS